MDEAEEAEEVEEVDPHPRWSKGLPPPLPKEEQEVELGVQHGAAQGAKKGPAQGDAAVARLKRALCWRDAPTEAAFVRRTGLSLLL